MNNQWKEIVDLNFQNESKISDLKTLSEKSIKLSLENNSCIEMLQTLVKDLQNTSDKNSVLLNDLSKSKVDIED